jgi:signal transduction histidine kinase
MRALLEGWAAALLVLIFLFKELRTDSSVAVSSVMLLIAALGAGVSALRMRRIEQLNFRAFALEIGQSLLLAAGLMTLNLMAQGLNYALALSSHSQVESISMGSYVALSAPALLLARAVAELWFRWDRLRHRSFAWELTNAHLTIVITVGIVGLMGGIFFTTNLQQSLDQLPAGALFPRILIWVFTLILISAMFALGSLLFFLPFSAIFSYWLARRMTMRLEALARAAQSLRAGKLDTRVVVEGEDEIARLQADFNAMAADLWVSTRSLQEERDKVTQLLRMQRELTASVSHELRTPAATLSGYLEAMQRSWRNQAPEEVDHDLMILSHEADRLKAILNDLLTLSQAEVNQLSLDLQMVQLQETAARVVDASAGLAWRSKRVQVITELEPDLPEVKADPIRIEQVITNLVHNAIRHTPPGGVVVVSACREEGAVRVEVLDTGDGIAPEQLHRIWEKFYHTPDGGAGLGLALVKELTEAMGGAVEVESTLQQGSCFRIRLPVP